jgi:ribosomal protein S27E
VKEFENWRSFFTYIACKVAAEAEHQVNQYLIRINISTPGNELVVSREHHDRKTYENLFVMMRCSYCSNITTVCTELNSIEFI